MNRVKPPYKFKSPYWTHNPAEKRFRILTFGPNGVFKEIGNSESNYYKACTLDLPSYKTTKMKEQIKQLRVEIDGLAQLCEGLKPIKDEAAIHYAIGHLGSMPPYYMTEEDLKKRHEEYKKEYDRIDKATSKNTEEIKEAIKSLKLSKAWLGKVLESLGSDSPYKSGYKTVEDIEPETDKAKTVCGTMGIDGETTPRLKAIDTFTLNGKIMNEYSQMSHIEKVDWLREEIKQLANTVLEINGGKLNQRTYSEYEEKLQWNAYSYLQEARFWLGFELGRIKNYSNE